MTKFNVNLAWLVQRPYLIAAAITFILVLWMASGVNADNSSAVNKRNHSDEAQIKAQVQVESRQASMIFKTLELYGRTEPNRTSTLKAEIRGKIEQVLAQRGAKVDKGQIIAKIALNDLPSQLIQSQALLKQREIEYQGALQLNKKGYQGKVKLAQAFANLEAVKADITRLEVNIENTVLRAPFAGILNTRYVEVGDYVASGDKIALIADLNPLVVRAYVTEKQIASLSIGQKAEISLLNSEKVSGQLRYIASIANEATNTFKIEVAVANDNDHLLAGLSSELTIALDALEAIKLSPALLALDEQGNIGVKTVENEVVKFTPIDIVKSEPDGIWLTGLGKQSNIITLGQGFVRAGDSVEAIYSHNSAASEHSEALAVGITTDAQLITH